MLGAAPVRWRVVPPPPMITTKIGMLAAGGWLLAGRAEVAYYR